MVAFLVLLGLVLQSVSIEAALSVNISSYFEKYGYGSDINQDTIRLFQRKSSLPITGRINEDTLKRMITPRCGVEDIVSKNDLKNSRFFNPLVLNDGRATAVNFVAKGTRWAKFHLTWKQTSFTQDLPRKAQTDTIRKAFQAWAAVSNLTFTQVGINDDADIIIDFAENEHGDGSINAFDGKGGVLAHAFYPSSGQMHFDDAEQWSLSNSDSSNTGAVNLEWVAMHELGHALGLGHSDVFDSVMFPFYPGFVDEIKLRKDDIDGIQFLYNEPKVSKPNDPRPNAPKPNDPRPNSPNPEHTTRYVHKPPPPPTTPAPKPTNPGINGLFPSSPRPRRCPGGIDAALTDQVNNLYFIHGTSIWSFTESGINPNSPYNVQQFFTNAPYSITAGFTSRTSLKTYLITETFVAIYSGFHSQPKFYHLSQIRMPSSIDAIFQWPRNDKIYIFTGNLYYRWNEDKEEMDPGYPRLITEYWPGFPVNIDTIFSWNGISYLIKDNRYWKLKSDVAGLESVYPGNFLEEWFKCRSAGRASLGLGEINADVEP